MAFIANHGEGLLVGGIIAFMVIVLAYGMLASIVDDDESIFDALRKIRFGELSERDLSCAD